MSPFYQTSPRVALVIAKMKVMKKLNYMARISSSQSDVPSQFFFCRHLMEVASGASGEICKSENFRSYMLRQKSLLIKVHLIFFRKLVLDLLRMSFPPHKSFLELNTRVFRCGLLNSFSHFREGRTLKIKKFFN